jgi:hypothetical protein
MHFLADLALCDERKIQCSKRTESKRINIQKQQFFPVHTRARIPDIADMLLLLSKENSVTSGAKNASGASTQCLLDGNANSSSSCAI